MVEMDKSLMTRFFISILFLTLLVSPTLVRGSVNTLDLAPTFDNTVRVNLTHGMVYSTYSSQVLGLQDVFGSQWWRIRMFNEKDVTGGLIHSPQITVQTPMSWDAIRSFDPANETFDAGTERVYTWTRDYLVQGNTLDTKIYSNEEIEFSLPFDSFRMFSLETISEKYAIGTLTVVVVPHIDPLPNSVLAIILEARQTDEVVPEILEHTLFFQGTNNIQPSVEVDKNYLQLSLEKWKKAQEIRLKVDVRVKNRLYNPDSNSNHMIRYVPCVRIAYTEKQENVIEHFGNSRSFRTTRLGQLAFSANGTYHWLTEGSNPHITKMVLYQQISLPTELLVEIGIDNFYLKKDKDPDTSTCVGEVFFEIKTGNMTHSFRAPEFGYEERLPQTHNPRPGPVFIPDRPQTLPIITTIEAFERDASEVENLTENPQIVTIGSIEELLSNQPHIFNLSDIYIEACIRPATRIGDPTIRYQNLGAVQITESVPNDEFLQNQWYWFEIGADKIWADFEQNNFTEIIVAVIDTGVDFTHPDLHKNILRDSNGRIVGRNTVNHDDNVMDDSPSGHGTMMAGLIAAETNNREYIAGIAPNVRIMPIKVVDENGALHASDVADSIYFAVDHGADIISMSVGSYLMSDMVKAAIHTAHDYGILVITAVGNERTTKATIPASYPETLAVTGVRRVGDHIVFADGFSNYGPNLTSSMRSPWLSAPAINIWSTNSTIHSNGTGIASGTSFATPIVSASVALILGYVTHRKIDAPLDWICWLLQASATDLGPTGWDPYYGYGLVNVSRALELVNALGNVTILPKNPFPAVNSQLTINYLRYMGSNLGTSEMEARIAKTIHLKEKPQNIEGY